MGLDYCYGQKESQTCPLCVYTYGSMNISMQGLMHVLPKVPSRLPDQDLTQELHVTSMYL